MAIKTNLACRWCLGTGQLQHTKCCGHMLPAGRDGQPICCGREEPAGSDCTWCKGSGQQVRRKHD